MQGDTTGNRQPYAPEYLVTLKIGYARKNSDINLEIVYVSSQSGDFLNLKNGRKHPDGPESTNTLSGMFGQIPFLRHLQFSHVLLGACNAGNDSGEIFAFVLMPPIPRFEIKIGLGRFDD